MTPGHLDKIVPNALFGKRIIFENYLNIWQKAIKQNMYGIPLYVKIVIFLETRI